MYKFLFRFVVTSLTILTANLVTSAISNSMISYKNMMKPLAFTLFGMGIIVLVFYPLFIKLEVWISNISVRIVRSGNSIAGRYLGLLLTFAVCLFILTAIYLKIWFKLNIITIILDGSVGKFI